MNDFISPYVLNDLILTSFPSMSHSGHSFPHFKSLNDFKCLHILRAHNPFPFNVTSRTILKYISCKHPFMSIFRTSYFSNKIMSTACVLMENARQIFGCRWKSNLSLRLIFLTVLASHVSRAPPDLPTLDVCKYSSCF